MSLIDNKGMETILNGLGSKLNDMEEHAYNSRPDYEQNDKTAPDYIKNRPFYDTRATEEVEITFDGTLDGKEYIQLDDGNYIVKVSYDVPEKESLIGETIRAFNGDTIEELTISEDAITVLSDDLYAIDFIFFAVNDTTVEGFSLSKGIWSIVVPGQFYLSYLKYTKTTGEIVEITFDGTPEGKEYIFLGPCFVKISNDAPEKESLIGGTIREYLDGDIDEYTISEDIINVVSDDLYAIRDHLFVINDTTFDGISLSKGIWSYHDPSFWMSYLKYTKTTGELKKIDGKYLQDIDWENITNKPFYDVIETQQFTYTNVSTSGQGAATLGSGRPFIEGETYTVIVNGESTEIVATDLGDGVLRLLYSGSSSTSNNIYYNEYTEGYVAWTWWSSGATVTIEGPFRDLKQIDKKYIPETVESIEGKTGDLSLSDFDLLQPYAVGYTIPLGDNYMAYQSIDSLGNSRWIAYGSWLFKRSSTGSVNVFNSSPVGNGVYITSYKRTNRSDTEPDEYAIVPSIYTKIITKGPGLTYPYFAHVMPQLDGKTVEDDWRCLTNIKYVKDYAIPTPETASVGQTIVVKAIDENGKPTEWEAADMPEVVQPDYNQNDKNAPDYIKNRPFYEHITNENNLMPEKSIEATTQSGDLWYQSGLNLGALQNSQFVSRSSVEVCCDGEVYEQVPVKSTYIGGGAYLVTIGNTETYPFKVDNGVAYFTTSGTHTLRVYEIVDPKTEIVTIPMKYLPVDTAELYVRQNSIPTGYAVSDYIDSNCLTKSNTTSYTPTSDYNPATKKYVDDVKQYVNDYTIPIPSVTEEDNDKILSVVDGKPAWITINNAEGVAY